MKAPHHSPTILAVNDTPDVLELFTVLLEREGYRVTTASNGRRALELAFSIEPDIVISDVVMPEMDGLEFCRRLKQHPRTADVPVLLVSALRTANEDSLKGLIAGADDYLELPFRRQELLVKVARLTERHRVERHYREIVEQAPDIIYTRDMDGYLTSINEAGGRFFGRPASEMAGAHLRELVGAEAAASDIAKTKESETEFPLRSLHYLKDSQGVPHYLEGIITLVRDGKGQPVAVRGVVRDITERKRAEEALSESEQRYRQMFEKNRAIKLLVDPLSGAIVDANPAACEFYGYSLEQLKAKNIGDINLLSPEEVFARIDRIISEQSSFFFAQHQLASGEMRDVEVHTSPIDLQGRQVLYSIVHDITERKLAEAALQENETKFRSAFDHSAIGMALVSPEGHWLQVNHSICEILGYSEQELLLIDFQTVTHPDDLEADLHHLQQMLDGEINSYQMEKRYIHKLGHVVWATLSVSLVRDVHDAPLYFISQIQDITERKRAVEALRHSEERYRELFENANDLIYTHDLAGNFTSLNKAGERITGYTRDEAMQMSIAQVVVPEHLERARQMIARKAAEDVSTVYELDIEAKDGRRVALELSTRLIYSEGQPAGVQGIGRNITERKRAEEALSESERRFREMLENIQLAALMLDVQGNLTFCNDYLLWMTGWEREEVIGRNWFELFIPSEQREVLENIFTEMIAHGKVSSHIEHELEARTGERRLISWNNTLLRDPQGTVIGTTSIGEDVTERANTEQRMLASMQQLEMLTALATAVKDADAVDKLLVGLADAITNLTDYRSSVVMLFTDEPPYHPRCLSRSSNVPPEFIDLVCGKPYMQRSMREMLESGVHIEVGELGYAAYYPPSHYYLLDRHMSERYKSDMDAPHPTDGPRWYAGDELFVPLITHEGEYIGLISLDDPRSGRAPDRQSVLPVVALARQITQLLAQQQAAEALTQQAEREAMINRISGAVRQSLDLAEVFRTAVHELGPYLNVDRCTLFMSDEEIGLARNMAEYHSRGVQPVGRDFDIKMLKDLISGIDQQDALVFDDAATDERLSHLYNRILRPVGVRSIMYVAIKVGDETPAAFALSTTRGLRHWRRADIALAKAVADQTGIAIRQAQLFQKAEATSAREALINRLSLAIRASLNLPEVLNTATRELGRALTASRVHLRLHEPGHSSSPLEHEYTAPHVQSIKHITVSYDDPVGQRLLRSSQTIVIDDALNYSSSSVEFNEHIRRQAALTGMRSSIDCPLVVNGRFRGTLCINQTDRVRHWKEDEVSLVESVAAQLATGIAQAELYEMAKRARKEWETTFNAMSDGIFIFDNAGQLIRVNRAGATMEDTWPHLLLNRNCCDILRTSGDSYACIVEQTIKEGRTVTVEIMPERYNRPLLVTVEPIIENGNQTVGAVCTARDLSELRKVEAEARENQSLLMNILESAREAIYAVDTEGRFQWCNSATLATGGYKPEDLIGHHFVEWAYEGDREMIRDRFELTLKGEAQAYEMRYFTKDGNVRYALMDNAPLVVDGRTTGILGIARDITEQKQERQRASQADKLRALGQLASGVAHDFNNALAAILGRAQLMRRQIHDEAMTRNLDIIQTAAEDAAATVRRIQTFARQSQAKEFELLEAGSLLRDAVEITRTRWENEARTRGLHYEVELDAQGEMHTRGSASELREVFVNLIVNAVDAMPFGGRLSIGCERKDEHLCLRFSDTGMGMSEEVRERIFEPFYTTKGMQGTGLGLAVSYGIIERHGGQINVESEVGKGTTFEIDLPVAESLGLKAAQSMAQAETPSLSILVIDDESFVRETLGDMLTILSHRVGLVASGREALDALGAEHFDLVFTDLSMPEMDGWEVAREIRRRWPEVLIVLVTGYGKGTEPPSGEKNLIDGVIGKPFDFSQVTETITQVTTKTVMSNE
jgi:PAS domain S-box-containing protein